MTQSILILLGLVLAGAALILYIIPVNLWITATFSNVYVNLIDLVLMRFRRVPPALIVNVLILAAKAGIKDVTTQQLETHHLANGNLLAVIKALIVADKANLEMSFKQAAAIDLAGRNVLEAVHISVTPYMIIVPAITGVSRDGIQLIAECRVTVRTNLKQLVGGAGEETIKARVGQGIISRIGSAQTFKQVLENPEIISKLVLSKGLDAGTAFEILSIDIADINIGINIGAKLQIDQAMADLNVAKAKAEERRAQAVALEQEMLAQIQEARAQVIEAETLIPAALSYSFRAGNLMQGYMKNSK
ncbi:MAG: flotillin-like protein FloA [Reichenbachiella sp.]|uniref:flotillin-like protein FloA n=1 Tax=Reichenbachiella sp. TaxID=2184521 RepID=UPI003267750A